MRNSQNFYKDKLPMLTSPVGNPPFQANTDIVINATSIGLFQISSRLDFDLESLTSKMVVADVIQTLLLLI